MKLAAPSTQVMLISQTFKIQYSRASGSSMLPPRVLVSQRSTVKPYSFLKKDMMPKNSAIPAPIRNLLNV